jgi:streptomycin 6-kinase
MQIYDNIPPDRLLDCLCVLDRAGIPRDEIISISRAQGGLFNFVLRVDTLRAVLYFKQYLEVTQSPIFDPPSTPRSRRLRHACRSHQCVRLAVASYSDDIVPEILVSDRSRSAILMKAAAASTPLIEYLSAGKIPQSILTTLPQVLASIHNATFDKPPDRYTANLILRDYKLSLQYDGILKHLAKHHAEIVILCKHQYQKRRCCLAHGDLNSRNILVDTSSLGIIDFDQSHLGSPEYDLAYLLCELFVSLFCHQGSILQLLGFLDEYFSVFQHMQRRELEVLITNHLAVQTLYRFWGPSRASWTYYVEPTQRRRVIKAVLSWLSRDPLPISALLASTQSD